LNLYSGIGGNRTLWGESHSITSVEFDPSIAKIYAQRFPNDTLIIGDALDYLLNNYLEFDFFLQKYLPEDKFFCVENVVPYYEPFIQPSGTINRHCFWTNYDISQIKFSPFIPTYENVGTRTVSLWYNHLGFSLSDIDTSGVSKIKVLRNCVHPKVALLLLARILKPLQTLEDFL
jgi:DNA (cytosine-5)-methyltransferase 1